MKQTPKQSHIPFIAAALAFMSAFAFFLIAYPYHLIRREQMNLFLFDWDYIGQTYRGSGWLVRFVCDFLEQFFHLPVVGPIIVAAALTGIGVVTYKLLRRLLPMWPSLIVAALLFAWSFLRETENLYSTRYTLVVLGYLSLLLLAVQPRQLWGKAALVAVLLPLGIWALGSPWHRYWGKAWGKPELAYDKVIGLDAEVARENWDKVIRLSAKDLHMVEASYCFNLAHAMKGDLNKVVFSHTQDPENSLLFRVSTARSAFSNCLAGEAWYQLGDMTVAEQSAIIMLQASPKHTGARYVKRLAQTSLASGQEASAQKYLKLLSKTLFYGKWAREQQAHAAELISRNLARRDFVHSSIRPRPVLHNLLEANPSNALAREYLLCLELLNLDLDSFMEDYGRFTPAFGMEIPPENYQEAMLIWLSLQDRLGPADLATYGIPLDGVDKMARFMQRPTLHKSSYWYYYWNLMTAD